MLLNYLKIAWRNLSRNSGYAFINIAGLAVALAVFMMIVFYVRHETSYDRYMPESDRVFRMMINNSDTDNTYASMPEGLPEHLKSTFPEVRYAARVGVPSTRPSLMETRDRQVYRSGFMSAPEDFFNIFPYRFIYGSPEASLSSPQSIVLTKSLSDELFGEGNPVGSTVTLYGRREHTVTAVVEDPPSNTYLRFSAVTASTRDEDEMGSWRYGLGPVFVKLAENSAGGLQRKLPDYVQTYADFGEGRDPGSYEMFLQPLSEVYLYPEGRRGGSDKMVYIRIFFAAALLILLIACVNYINLATARSVERAREIGVRKSVGADRFQIIQQVMTETLVTCGLAFLLGLFLFEVSLPQVQRYLGVDLSAMSWFNGEGLLILGVLWIGVSLLSGLYCAFYLASFSPGWIFQGGRGMPGGSKVTLRKALVVAQFAVSLTVIIGTVLIARQMNYIRETRLDGEDSEILLITNTSDEVTRQFDAFRQELMRSGAVGQVAAGNMIGQPGMSMELAENDLGIPNMMYWIDGTHEYLETLGADLVSGRFLNPEMAGDSSGNVLLNESAARLLGVEKATGQFVPRPVNANVVGIVEDFHDQTFYQKITPTMFRYGDGSFVMSNIFVHLRDEQVAEGLRHAQRVWDSFDTGFPFRYTFLDQELDNRYRAELRMASVFKGFAGFSIFIACLGLFGLAAFSARRRTKEIGIRKVLGATVSNIVALLSREFVLLVGLGFLVAVPVALYGVNRWLQEFAYRIEVGAEVFMVVGVAVLLIALLTVSGQSIRAARANPAESLRTE